MALSSATAYYGMVGTSDLTGEGVSGTASIGRSQTAENLALANKAVTFAIELDDGGEVEIDNETLEPTITGGTGVAQVETATVVAASGVTSDGTLVVTVTLGGVAYPVNVALTAATHTTATLIATAIRTAINLDLGITAIAGASSSGADVILTIEDAAANDTTMNIAWPASLGISAVTTSVNTTAGLAPTKCYRLAGTTFDGENFEGGAIGTVGDYYGFEARVTEGEGLAYLGISNTSETLKQRLLNGGVHHEHNASSSLLSLLSPTDNLIFSGHTGYTKAIVSLFFSTE